MSPLKQDLRGFDHAGRVPRPLGPRPRSGSAAAGDLLNEGRTTVAAVGCIRALPQRALIRPEVRDAVNTIRRGFKPPPLTGKVRCSGFEHFR